MIDIQNIRGAVSRIFKYKASKLFLDVVITISFIPVIALVTLWIYIWFVTDTRQWAFQMMDYAIKIIDHIWSAQIVAGVIAYGSALVDKNQDGIPDTFEDNKEVGK